MKKALFLAAFLCTVFAGLEAKPLYVTASQNYVTKDVTELAAFSALSVSGQAEVDFRQGPAGQYSVSLYGPDNLVDLVQVRSDGQTLFVEYKEPLVVVGEDHLTVSVTAPELTRVQAHESGEVKIWGPLTSSALAVEADGKTEVGFSSVNIPAVTADVRGDAEVDFDSLTCQTLTVTAAGTASFDSDRTACDAVNVTVAGRGEVSVSGIAGRTVETVAQDNAEAELKGRALSARLEASGKSELDAGGLTVETADVKVSGSAKAEVRATGTLNAQTQGRGAVEYKGWPRTVNRKGNVFQDR